MPVRTGPPPLSTSEPSAPRPGASATPVKLRVTRSAERSLRAGHPWLYAERIREQSHEGAVGDLAVVFDRERRFVAVGLYDPHAPLRMLSLACDEPTAIDDAFFAGRIARAVARRSTIAASADQAQGTDGYRIVHGENDGMPGFVADRYGETLVIKLYSQAWQPHLAVCAAALAAHTKAVRVVLRLSRQLAAAVGELAGAADGRLLIGEPARAPLTFRENGLCFELDPVRGQKTGFFLDQRENRARVEAIARDRRVLNAFAYTGAFSLYAARGGAREVWSLDQSSQALACAERNFARNTQAPGVARARHETHRGDAFRVMTALAHSGERFGLVVIDPPSFATRRAQVESALASYMRLAELGLRLLEPDGRIVLASCSSAVSAEAFRRSVCTAARRSGRPLRNIEAAGHPPDHPVDFEESRYLECLFAVA